MNVRQNNIVSKFARFTNIASHITLKFVAVYILDDGKDPDKKAWVQKQNDPELAYTPGHIKSGPEINGKACNLNATLRALFPAGTDVPMEEVSYLVICNNNICNCFLGCIRL